MTERAIDRQRDGRALHVCFFFNAQRHQLLHGIGPAVSLARMAGYEVVVASPSADHIAYAERLTAALGGAPIRFVTLSSRLLAAAQRWTGRTVPPKLLSLARHAAWFNRFDAIALPERTSLILKSFGVRHPAYIHLDHGAGDRAAGFDRRTRHFDFALMPGEKHRERLEREGLVRPGASAVTGYPKFEAADAVRDPGWTPFGDDRRPIVLYNPHFAKLGSWERCGGAVLEAFATQDRYNLIVAPHVRLLDGRRADSRWTRSLECYAAHPRIRIDRGSDRSIDMTYTMLADVYLGDVSSQIYEFLRVPRPCLFINAHGVDWADDENYLHWRLGPVIGDASRLIEDIEAARAGHADFLDRQRQAFANTFDMTDEPSAERAAAAIARYLRERRAAAAIAA